MARQNLVVVGAKLNMEGQGIQVQEDCEMTVMELMEERHGKFIKQHPGLGDPIAKRPLTYLRRSLRTVDPKKTAIVYIKEEGEPAYLLHVVPEKEPKEKLQRDLLTKYLPDRFIYCGLTADKIKPLSEKEQQLVEKWFSEGIKKSSKNL